MMPYDIRSRVRKTRESPAGRGGAEEAFEKIPRGGAGPGQRSKKSRGAGRARDSNQIIQAGRGGPGAGIEKVPRGGAGRAAAGEA